jgi:hypothetical protein
LQEQRKGKKAGYESQANVSGKKLAFYVSKSIFMICTTERAESTDE